jgi:hypothetical protein
MKVLPSMSVSVQPSAWATKIGIHSDLASATAASLRATHSRDSGPGISVRRTIEGVMPASFAG